MSESLTISQLAKELNISRQKIYRFIDKQENTDVHQYIYINSNKIKMINAEGVRYIKENINRTANGQRVDSERTTTKSIEDNASELFGEDKKKIRTEDGQVSDSGRTTFFIKQIEQKDVQIQLLQQIIEKNQNLLDQQQRLALQDKKLLEEYKAEINELKSLKAPEDDMKQEKEEILKEEVEKLKKQLNELEEQKLETQEQEEIKPLSKKWWQLWK
ncbi:hypothetical protein BFG91_15385 [Listeria monocytogenes]|nr:hypothetical protein [Listeria monocytogenes]